MPRFSIVIPSYNNAEFLPGCLDSLKAQSFSDWNAIVVVDASPDESADIVRSHAAEDSRFVLLNKEVNGGAHLARRDGVLAANGDYITFLDADDELTCDALEKLSGILPGDENLILHFGLTCEGEGVDSARAVSFEGWPILPTDNSIGIASSKRFSLLSPNMARIGTLITGSLAQSLQSRLLRR